MSSPDPSSSSFEVRVRYRGASHSVSLPADATVADLGAALEVTTGASLETQKILLGVKGRNDTSETKGDPPAAGSLEALGIVAGTLMPSKSAHALVAVSSVPGLRGSAKPLMLMGTPARDLDALRAEEGVDHRVAGFDEEERRLRRRRRNHVSRTTTATGRSSHVSVGPPSTATHPYTFESYRPLPVPDAVTPPASAALTLLHKLASDPGILGVMAKHKWRVPLLAEMPPEGKVGVSEACVLGYNVNAGAEIHLRLRTDDLRGFRRYARIRETLLHELTHNVWSDHDVNFKRLCSQLNVECKAFDWKRSGNGARALGDGASVVESDGDESWSEDETMAATKKSSGLALGGRRPEGGAPEESAAAAAARAAASRAADVVEREMASLARDAIEAAAAANHDPMDEDDVFVCREIDQGSCACGACESSAPLASHAVGSRDAGADTMKGINAEGCASGSASAKTSAASFESRAAAAVGVEEITMNEDAARAHAASADVAHRAESACAALVAGATSVSDAVIALDTLATIIGNALSAPPGPAGDKYRAIRPSNAAFHRRAGRHPGAQDLLRAAGFQSSVTGGNGNGEAVLRLTRDDPALLYVVKCAVTDAATRIRAC